MTFVILNLALICSFGLSQYLKLCNAFLRYSEKNSCLCASITHTCATAWKEITRNYTICNGRIFHLNLHTLSNCLRILLELKSMPFRIDKTKVNSLTAMCFYAASKKFLFPCFNHARTAAWKEIARNCAICSGHVSRSNLLVLSNCLHILLESRQMPFGIDETKVNSSTTMHFRDASEKILILAL